MSQEVVAHADGGRGGGTRRLQRTAVSLLAALLVIVGANLGLATGASAYAYSCTGYGWISIPGTSVASSRWCGETNGSGRYVSSVKGGFTALIAGVYLCDTRMRAQFFDSRGNSMGTYYSGTRYGCWQAGGVFAVSINRTFPDNGYVRISLLSYGAEKAAVQHNIKA